MRTVGNRLATQTNKKENIGTIKLLLWLQYFENFILHNERAHGILRHQLLQRETTLPECNGRVPSMNNQLLNLTEIINDSNMLKNQYENHT